MWKCYTLAREDIFTTQGHASTIVKLDRLTRASVASYIFVTSRFLLKLSCKVEYSLYCFVGNFRKFQTRHDIQRPI
jgi:hypothetical protein